MKKIALFSDVQNIYYTTRDVFGRPFNYRSLLKKIAQQGQIVTAKAYAIDKGDDQQIKFQDALKHLGFEVKLKPYIQRRDGSAKGDWDVGIAVDIMQVAASGEVDTIILLSGDGDFDLLLHAVRKEYGVQTEVYGVLKLTAGSLIEAADEYHPIRPELLI
jgi:uncharacterized LabA/DUF88 family protein